MSTFTLACDHGNGYIVSHSFEAETLQLVEERVQDFYRGCGFFPPEEEDEEPDFGLRLLAKDHLPTPDEWMWDDSLPMPDH